MNGALGQWWRYPYGVAGPAVVTYLAATAIAGAVSALALKGLLWQLGPGFVVLSLGERVAQMASRRYARKRHIARPPRPGQMRQAVERWSGIWLAYIAGVIPIVVGWHYGWSWTLIAGALLAYQLPIRWRWAKRGYPGDPRWARDWSRETHPAYEFRGVSEFLRGHYDEAQRLFRKALEDNPGNHRALYSLACAEARAGALDAAVSHLNEAVLADERWRKQAQKDPDFVAIRDDPRFPR